MTGHFSLASMHTLSPLASFDKSHREFDPAVVVQLMHFMIVESDHQKQEAAEFVQIFSLNL